jgi:hypothetical protein
VSVVEARLRGVLLEGDLDLSVRGAPRWHGTLRKARRAMSGEGWLEPDGGRIWRITESGRRIASVPPSEVAPRRAAVSEDVFSPTRRGTRGAR